MPADTYKVIIADDSPVVRSVVREILMADSQYQICAEAASGAEALEAIRTHTDADGLLLDVHLGDMTGVDVLQEIDGSVNGLAIVMLTGVTDSTVVRDCLRYGAKGYLLKDETNWHLSLVERLTAAIFKVKAKQKPTAGE